MSEYEKLPPYNAYTPPPPYNPQQYPQPEFQGLQQMSSAAPQTSGSAHILQPQVIAAPITTVIQTAGFGESPTQTMCAKCQTTVITRVSNEFSNCQHLLCCCMCITGVCTLFSCLPYCCCSCANVRHECPRCGRHLGSYTR